MCICVCVDVSWKIGGRRPGARQWRRATFRRPTTQTTWLAQLINPRTHAVYNKKYIEESYYSSSATVRLIVHFITLVVRRFVIIFLCSSFSSLVVSYYGEGSSTKVARKIIFQEDNNYNVSHGLYEWLGVTSTGVEDCFYSTVSN